ncbi:tRNA threonylcarbamoyladenosine dehydratase [Pseudobutyrivibrio ruminis]|uniref:tRNA threonylcarbamoyladenosine dehydratase n=1 Tax=Pseudobutyrivibrio ruminis TaxID=46206 RepID=UPI0003F8BFA2|nr:tRNA threonylcarbamoyladenosine dehydratase [Pseudobutyrivibrio ruminis]
MLNQFSRTELLLGHSAMEELKNKKVAIFGIGGVGGYVCEALVRSGVGHFEIIDNDDVSLTNINRQIIATHSTVGRLKVDVMKERMLDINPEVDVVARQCFYLPDNADEFDFTSYDYVVDAVDTVTAKLSIICRCKELGVPVISSMGTGNKLNPAAFEIADIYDTTMCPLAKVMRKELKKRDIDSLKVVYSKEKPVEQASDVTEVEEPSAGRRSIPGSTAFCPPVAGLILASEVIKDLTGTFSRD